MKHVQVAACAESMQISCNEKMINAHMRKRVVWGWTYSHTMQARVSVQNQYKDECVLCVLDK